MGPVLRFAVPGGIANGLYLVLWGLLAVTASPDLFTPIVLGLTSVLLFVGILVHSGPGVLAWHNIRPHFSVLLLVGAIAGILNLLAAWGIKVSSATSGAIILRTDILFSVLLGWFLYRETPTTRQALGAVLVLAGMLVMFSVDLAGLELVRGELLLLASAALIAINATLIKVRLKGVPDAVVAALNSGTASLVLGTRLAAEILTGDLSPSWPLALPASLVILASTLSAGEFLLYYRSLRVLPVWIVRTIYLLAPVTAALVERLAGGEGFTVRTVVTLALVGIGTVVISPRACSQRQGVTHVGI